MAQNYDHRQGCGGLNQLGLGDIDALGNQRHGGNVRDGSALSSIDAAQARNGTPGVMAPQVTMHNNGINGGVLAHATSGQDTSLGMQSAPPPSSWAAKVRAGLGSENSPILTGGAGLGGLGDFASSDLAPPQSDDGLPGIPRAMGGLGQLAGGMGPVHGLDMEGGMPSRSLAAATGAPGAKGMGVVGTILGGESGHQDPIQRTASENGEHGVPHVVAGVTPTAVEGGSSLAFADLNLSGVNVSDGVEAENDTKGFDTSKDELLGDFPCVRMRGLAADISVKDILDFFVGLGPVLDIVLEDAEDNEVGAITLFGNLMDYHGALQRYSLQLKGRYIEVASASRSDYYDAVIKRSGPADGGADTNARGTFQVQSGPGRGVDLSAEPGEAHTAQSRVPGSVGGAKAGSQGRSTQPGPSSAAASGAVGVVAPAGAPAVANMQTSTSAGSNLSGSTGHGAPSGARKGNVKAGPIVASKSKGLMGDGKGAVIRMRGLPYRASKTEVMGFFKGCSIPEEGIAFVTRADGRVTGEAYVRFASREDAKMGIRKDREMMGSRYIELFASSPEEMSRYANSKR